MTAQQETDAVARYAAAVRAALAELGEDERAQLLGDLEAHLAEVAAESGVPLAERLGPPEAYAAELRAAYRVPAAARQRHAHPSPRRWWRRRLLVLLALAVVFVVGSVIAQAGWSSSRQATADQWSVSRLQSEAAVGHVRRVEIPGTSGIATDGSGVRHAVNLPDSTASLASELVRDDVDVVYQQSSSSSFRPLGS